MRHSAGEEALVTSEVLSNDYRGKTEMSRPGDGFQGDIRRFVSMPNIDFHATHTPVRMISRVQILSTTPTWPTTPLSAAEALERTSLRDRNSESSSSGYGANAIRISEASNCDTANQLKKSKSVENIHTRSDQYLQSTSSG